MPFGSQKKKENTNMRQAFENAIEEHITEDFLREYQALVEKYDLILTTTAVPFQIVLARVSKVIESNKNGNDWHNYHEPIAPETKQGILEEILDISFKME